MEYCKLQIGCLIILLYLAFNYCKECLKFNISIKRSLFFKMMIVTALTIILDGATAYTVNHLESVNPTLNMILHLLFLIGLDSAVFMLFVYVMHITGEFPKKSTGKLIIYTPYIINIIVVIANIQSLRYIEGNITNYSMGISAYTCFAMVSIYSLASVVVFVKRWSYIEGRKRISILTYICVLMIVMVFQMIFPEILMTSLALLILILGVYMNQEDPALEEVRHYHNEMIMGFANLIENRDNSTGGHIKRTSLYVQAIAKALDNTKEYGHIISKDYIANMMKAAPMHDIGKISIPDAILQKPGKLTIEEFEIMKTHTTNGGKIVLETFGNLGNQEYQTIAYNMAYYHHEKYNGKGYPSGKQGKEIPLCARIMAVADVFDAVSENRCYREALPLDECFNIIAQGSGTDFDPDVVKAFLSIKDEIIEIHHSLNQDNLSNVNN